MQLWTQELDRPIRTLTKLYIGWKLILLLLALSSPGPGYDTSSSLLLSGYNRESSPVINCVTEKLTRWDAIYFVKAAQRGHLFEQEWAFSWGFSNLIRLLTDFLATIGVCSHRGFEGIIAISIAHIAHLLSVIVLFHLTTALFPQASSELAFKTALLHIISPAGIFLSAPYAESSCALLSFLGCLLFTKGTRTDNLNSVMQDLLVVASGISFGIATTFRSNGILYGLLLLEEAFRVLFTLKSGLKATTFRRLLATGLGGLSVGIGFILPQYIAYSEYCVPDRYPSRPWCEEFFPSVYTFVQSHYWNVGLFRYWTLSNLPLFILATPMFILLVLSSIWIITYNKEPKTGEVQETTLNQEQKTVQILSNLAVSQLLLVLLTSTTAHVQIITRISSAYPVWLWYCSVSSENEKALLLDGVVKFTVMYAVIQGGLFASFLPPA